mgnify:CR=1 FL=1
MSLQTYPVVLEPTADGFGVFFPDLPGCVSFGADYESAVANSAEALSLHLEGMAEDGEAYPERSAVADVRRDHAAILAEGGHIALIDAEAPDSSERVNVYLPKSLLQRVDRYSHVRGWNRSTFFNTAARLYMDVDKAASDIGGVREGADAERTG